MKPIPKGLMTLLALTCAGALCAENMLQYEQGTSGTFDLSIHTELIAGGADASASADVSASGSFRIDTVTGQKPETVLIRFNKSTRRTLAGQLDSSEAPAPETGYSRKSFALACDADGAASSRPENPPLEDAELAEVLMLPGFHLETLLPPADAAADAKYTPDAQKVATLFFPSTGLLSLKTDTLKISAVVESVENSVATLSTHLAFQFTAKNDPGVARNGELRIQVKFNRTTGRFESSQSSLSLKWEIKTDGKSVAMEAMRVVRLTWTYDS